LVLESGIIVPLPSQKLIRLIQKSKYGIGDLPPHFSDGIYGNVRKLPEMEF
jgi:hypothetical protein